MGYVGLVEFITGNSVLLLEFQFSFYKLVNRKILYPGFEINACPLARGKLKSPRPSYFSA